MKRAHNKIADLMRQLKGGFMNNKQLESQIETLQSGEDHLGVSYTKHISQRRCLNKIEFMWHLYRFESSEMYDFRTLFFQIMISNT